MGSCSDVNVKYRASFPNMVKVGRSESSVLSHDDFPVQVGASDLSTVFSERTIAVFSEPAWRHTPYGVLVWVIGSSRRYSGEWVPFVGHTNHTVVHFTIHTVGRTVLDITS